LGQFCVYNRPSRCCPRCGPPRGRILELGGPSDLTFNQVATIVQQATGRRAAPRYITETVLPTGDRDRACCVRGDGREITQVAGEHDRAGAGAGECGYGRVGCGDRRRPTSGGAQLRRLAGVRLGHVLDLAGLRQRPDPAGSK
jgi:hypothetical protein